MVLPFGMQLEGVATGLELAVLPIRLVPRDILLACLPRPRVPAGKGSISGTLAARGTSRPAGESIARVCENRKGSEPSSEALSIHVGFMWMPRGCPGRLSGRAVPGASRCLA